MKLYKLKKSVLKISNDIEKFFLSLTTNTLDKSKNTFVDGFGKIVVTSDQIQLNNNEVLIVVEKNFLQDMRKHLEPYLKLSKTKITAEPFFVYFNLDNDYTKNNDEFIIEQKNGQLILTNKELNVDVTDDEFTLFRLKNNIPLQGIDYHHEMLLNVDNEQYVSYTKGCFLGQEILARVHNLAKPVKKLMVKFEDEVDGKLKDKMTSKMKDPETGRIMGFVFVDNK